MATRVCPHERAPRGAGVNLRDVSVSGKQRLALWQIHPDGTRRETVIEEIEPGAPPSTMAASSSPPVKSSRTGSAAFCSPSGGLRTRGRPAPRQSEEYVYRVDGDGKLVYKLPMPAYDGPLKDSMVLGENSRGFTTRGSLLIAFDVGEGKESWRWDAGVRGVEVFAALADGGCLVQTPDALVHVRDAAHAIEVMKGQAMMGWNGQIYLKRGKSE